MTKKKSTTKKKRINSKRKGASEERLLAKYLCFLGYAASYRGKQYKGGLDSPDVVVPGLKNVHIECKSRRDIGVGTHALQKAMDQALSDALAHQVPAVMWRTFRKPWRLSWLHHGHTVTTCGDAEIKYFLDLLNESGSV